MKKEGEGFTVKNLEDLKIQHKKLNKIAMAGILKSSKKNYYLTIKYLCKQEDI